MLYFNENEMNLNKCSSKPSDSHQTAQRRGKEARNSRVFMILVVRLIL